MPIPPAPVLIPQPRSIQWYEGSLERSNSQLYLASVALVPVGKSAQSELQKLGYKVELTCHRADDLLAEIRIDPQSIAQAEGYRLRITPRLLQIVAHDPAGAFYAVQTLRQLVRQTPLDLPCLEIHDYPDFPNRGVMLDISRDKVPTLTTLESLVDLLSSLKLNRLQLYTEHTFAYRRHKEVWQHASPLTGEEILRLDAYCRERFIELVPNQNSFGHMERWLQHESYRALGEVEGSFTDPFGNLRPNATTLNPGDPRSLQLIEELFDELLPHFGSSHFNVGCDETWELGQGKSREACAEKGTERVYLEFLLKIHERVRRRGRTMQFWGDIILHRPELIAELPKDLIALNWGYEQDHPFERETEHFAKANIPFYVCPGTSSWCSLIGRTANALGNLDKAAEYGLKSGASGYLITDWGDFGHWQPLSVSYLGFAAGAAASWCHGTSRAVDLAAALSRHVFEDRSEIAGRLVYDLGNAYLKTGALFKNSNIFAQALLQAARPAERAIHLGLNAPGMTSALEELQRLSQELPRLCLTSPDAATVSEELRMIVGLAQHGARQAHARLTENAMHSANQLSAATKRILFRELDGLLPHYRSVWMLRNRLGGLKDSAARLEEVLKLYA